LKRAKPPTEGMLQAEIVTPLIVLLKIPSAVTENGNDVLINSQQQLKFSILQAF
jgi:hypothetical protein